MLSVSAKLEIMHLAVKCLFQADYETCIPAQCKDREKLINFNHYYHYYRERWNASLSATTQCWRLCERFGKPLLRRSLATIATLFPPFSNTEPVVSSSRYYSPSSCSLGSRALGSLSLFVHNHSHHVSIIPPA